MCVCVLVCVPPVADPSLRDHEDQFGRTPLMYCVLADRLDCAEILLKAGASVNKTDNSQRTALHLAAQKVRWLELSAVIAFECISCSFIYVCVYKRERCKVRIDISGRCDLQLDRAGSL